jgi:hypothetical protein
VSNNDKYDNKCHSYMADFAIVLQETDQLTFVEVVEGIHERSVSQSVSQSGRSELFFTLLPLDF